jgi:hypothetical protein
LNGWPGTFFSQPNPRNRKEQKMNAKKKSNPPAEASDVEAASLLRPAKSREQRSREEVAGLAYEIWEREGRPSGRDADHWHQAEALLRNGAMHEETHA